MDTAINITNLAAYIDETLLSINDGVAASRIRGIQAEMPLEVKFDVSVTFDSQSATSQSAQDTLTTEGQQAAEQTTDVESKTTSSTGTQQTTHSGTQDRREEMD